MKITNSLATGLKGFAMGAANVIPGVSGGTIALLTGIFSEIINSINALLDISVWKLLLHKDFGEFWKRINGSFLLALFAGIIISIFSLAKLMVYVMDYYPVQTWAFFFGLIIASSVYMIAEIKAWKLKDFAFFILGIAAGVLLCTMSPTNTPDSLWFIFICGAIAVCTMILPGVSGSFILVIMGKYDYIMAAINNLDLAVLSVFAIGCVLGLAGFSKLLHYLLKKHERPTMIILVGFVIGALVKVWPWNDMTSVATAQFLRNGLAEPEAIAAAEALMESGVNLQSVIDLQTFGALIWALIGMALVAGLEYLSHRHQGKPIQKSH